jgi:universal stress protein A
MEEPKMKIEKILVPVDFSKHSEAAMELARGLAQNFHAEICLLHVYSDAITWSPPYGPPMPVDHGLRIERAALEQFDEWREKTCPADLTVTSFIRRGDPSTEIVELARESQADLIVMGTRGATGLRRVLMGSVAERTVRCAPCPVITTKSDLPGDE